MTRRQHTVLILQVRIPVPAGKTQAQTIEWLRQRITTENGLAGGATAFVSQATQVKLSGKETVYL